MNYRGALSHRMMVGVQGRTRCYNTLTPNKLCFNFYTPMKRLNVSLRLHNTMLFHMYVVLHLLIKDQPLYTCAVHYLIFQSSTQR